MNSKIKVRRPMPPPTKVEKDEKKELNKKKCRLNKAEINKNNP